MTLQLASLASLILVATGMTIFALALKKATQMMSQARGIVEAVKACSKDLDRALEALQCERGRCERLGESLDYQLRNGRKARTDLIQAIGLVERISSGVASKATATAPQTTHALAAAHQAPPVKTADGTVAERKLPAFVHRTVKSVHAAQKLG